MGPFRRCELPAPPRRELLGEREGEGWEADTEGGSRFTCGICACDRKSTALWDSNCTCCSSDVGEDCL